MQVKNPFTTKTWTARFGRLVLYIGILILVGLPILVVMHNPTLKHIIQVLTTSVTYILAGVITQPETYETIPIPGPETADGRPVGTTGLAFLIFSFGTTALPF